MQSDLSTNDIEMYQLDSSENNVDLSGNNIEFDYEHIDEIIEQCQKMGEFKDVDRFLIWLMATDYWLKEEYKQKVSEIHV